MTSVLAPISLYSRTTEPMTLAAGCSFAVSSYSFHRPGSKCTRNSAIVDRTRSIQTQVMTHVGRAPRFIGLSSVFANGAGTESASDLVCWKLDTRTVKVGRDVETARLVRRYRLRYGEEAGS